MEQYTWTYPQLSLSIREGMSREEEYIDIVRRGILPNTPVFPLQETGFEEAYVLDTPAGRAEVLYLPERKIFEHFVRALAHRCEPVPLPPSMGAMMISGVNNWRKIEAHKKAYHKNGGTNWAEEFRAFTAKKDNYKDVILLVSRGNYSALTAEAAGFSKEEWIKKSKTIRIYHELTHFVSRKLFPENRDILRDEVLADSVGLFAVFGCYDALLAKKLLGIEGQEYRSGGRLENYVEEALLKEAAEEAKEMVKALEVFYGANGGKSPFELLMEAEQKRIGMEGESCRR